MKDTESTDLRRANMFFKEKFGSDMFNGHGMATILEEYRNWKPHMTSEQIRIEQIISDLGLRSKSRKEPLPDMRIIIAVYLRCYTGATQQMIADMLNVDHSSVNWYWKQYAVNDRLKHSVFKSAEQVLSSEYDLVISDPGQCIKILNK